eukprot:gnl/Hemi2/6825_TR2322_c0_g1_i1.p1 gnl/Hemi2/6825_TR2322_c0_g1~~gnl/Hemi2/6825_TR2322_c0_g1_i1.p1  ORF type:complete len:165 (-),score=16.74 gnl/Hemi2/6825_TR2322_c0_g1_i1:102-596(-)
MSLWFNDPAPEPEEKPAATPGALPRKRTLAQAHKQQTAASHQQPPPPKREKLKSELLQFAVQQQLGKRKRGDDELGFTFDFLPPSTPPTHTFEVEELDESPEQGDDNSRGRWQFMTPPFSTQLAQNLEPRRLCGEDTMDALHELDDLFRGISTVPLLATEKRDR